MLRDVRWRGSRRPSLPRCLIPRRIELTVINDFIGAGRCYELDFDGGSAWSNRIGALPLFTGVEAAADRRGWLMLAAATWFLGDSTPMAGVTRVPPGSVIRASDEGISREQTGAVSRLVVADVDLDDAAAAAADEARAQATTAGELWARRRDGRPVGRP